MPLSGRTLERPRAALGDSSGQSAGGPTLPLSEDAYLRLVRELARRLRGHQETLADLYASCLGAFPTVVKSALASQPGSGLRRVRSGLAARSATTEPAPWENDDLDLLDREWYFDLPSVRQIISWLPAATTSLVLLGVPTVAQAAAAAGIQTTLVDRSPWLTVRNLGLTSSSWQTRGKLIAWDLDRGSPPGVPRAEAVVLDPPWYYEHYRAWLRVALSSVAIGGTIIVVLPQALTNKHAVADRTRLLDTFQALGELTLVEDALRYVTPSFEREILGLAGLGSLDRWRRADAALIDVRSSGPEFADGVAPSAEWSRQRIGSLLVRTRMAASASSSPHPLPVIQPIGGHGSFRLTSVSRRYLAATGANLVTSRGRAAVISRWGRLPEIFADLAVGMPLQAALDRHLPSVSGHQRRSLERTIDQLLAL